MRVTFLVQSAHKLGGTERSAVTQANALAAAGHDVRILSVVKAAEQPVFAIDDRVAVEHLVDLTTPYDEALHARESVLVPPRWDKQFSALTDIGLEHGLTGLDTDVLVTVTPALLACAVQLAPDRGGRRPPGAPVVLAAHLRAWSRCSSTHRGPTSSSLLTPTIADWLRRQLGPGRARDRRRAEPAPPGLRAALAARLAGRSSPPAGW